ncbi:nitroreductase [Clostridium saccharoperbutylacetonicum]|uniref:Nitroreductase n=1 Tax=Clostridium saccharoperbutylacetonicum N1-4(HMT) TaxID=931276 RepID=M1MDU4_9CLOT|nr:nitroreductase [Clostridium saccharoperbutylacetonicum]AGF56089.1 nitroreductase [Clostridium saccharoperbutylacetonicum N1-4(HMT)]NRT63171.1 nitroreductase [Clostridium saccharoperbutylacetonicum]NSB26531.1 nitroreductase [Clostridium saccharoperbutylacetonicum]NSB45881.1 nitroreductase [Clostridium saccharoperbutylacetonicum]
MEILECINSKRSIRAYTDEIIPEEVLNNLIELGTKSSTGSGLEPWGFVIIQDKNEINSLSERTKQYLLDNFEKYPYLHQYENWLKNPQYSIFNHASTLLIIYGNVESHWHVYDCSLVAGNIMLAAHSIGIGTCWIGFAEHTLNTKEFKEKYGVPEQYELVCPMSIGYMKTKLTPPKRKKPIIFNKK